MHTRIDLYYKTIAVLKNALIKGIIANDDACACPCGNIIAASLGYDIKMVPQIHTPELMQYGYRWFKDGVELPYPGASTSVEFRGWSGLRNMMGIGKDFSELYHGEARRQIEASGYSCDEIFMIEDAFESQNVQDCEEPVIKGLLSVIEVLGEIHGLSYGEVVIEKESFVEINKNKHEQLTAGNHYVV